jgi:hypothetical protein
MYLWRHVEEGDHSVRQMEAFLPCLEVLVLRLPPESGLGLDVAPLQKVHGDLEALRTTKLQHHDRLTNALSSTYHTTPVRPIAFQTISEDKISNESSTQRPQ